NVTRRGMLISNEFITDDIHATEEYKEYEKVFVRVDVPMIQPQPVESTKGTNRTPSVHRTATPTAIIRVKQMKPNTTPIPPPSDDRERDEIAEATLLYEESYASEFADSIFLNDEEDSDTRLESGGHKENPETIDDDDVEGKKDEKKDDDDDDDNDDHTDHTLC
ncbi:hypothetical protein Tco_1380106, partial [Tanacetum coccineum]